MKTLTIILLLVLLPVSVFSQIADPAPGETFLITNLFEAFKLVLSYIDWLFVIIFIVVAWLINDTADAENTATWLTWYSKIPKVARVIFFGICLIIAYSYVFHYTARLEYFKLIVSLLFSMVAYKIGINKVFEAISTRIFGLKL